MENSDLLELAMADGEPQNQPDYEEGYLGLDDEDGETALQDSMESV